MRGIHLRIVALVVILAASWPAGTASADPLIPPTWTITGHETLTNQVRNQTGDIDIKSGGVLELLGSTLRLDGPAPYEPTIRVENGGRFYLNSSIGRSVLNRGYVANTVGQPQLSGDEQFHLQIMVEPGGLMEGHGCDISGTGRNQAGPFGRTPVEVYAGFNVHGTLVLENCSFHDARMGIESHNGSVFLNRVHAYRNVEAAGIGVGGGVVLGAYGGRTEIHHLESEGGLVGQTGGVFRMTHSTFVCRNAANGISIGGGATARLDGINLTGDCGHGIEVGDQATLDVRNVVIRDFYTAFENQGGDLIVNNATMLGGGAGPAILLSGGQSLATLTLTNSTIGKMAGVELQWNNRSSARFVNVAWHETASGPSEVSPIHQFRVLEVSLQSPTGANLTNVPISVSEERTGTSIATIVSDSHGQARFVLPYRDWNNHWSDAAGPWRITAAGLTKKVDLVEATTSVILAQGNSEETPTTTKHPIPLGSLVLLSTLSAALMARQSATARQNRRE